MPAVMSQMLTAEEFGRMPNPVDGSKQELVKGEIEEMPPPKARHGMVQSEIAWLLKNFVKPRKLGWVVTESGTILERDPDTVRGPDVSFYSIFRQPQPPEDYFEIPPDLAVEVLSPDDRRNKVRAKIAEYVTNGVRLVWLVDPEARTVMVYSGNTRGVEYVETDTLDGSDVLPGFTCPVVDLFG